MTEWSKVPDNVLELAQELVAEFHPDLEDARIGILFRGEVSIANGKEVWGKAEKVSEKMKAYLNLDFIIWLAKDIWFGVLTPHQRRALIDHELCHCQYTEADGAKMKGHDIEEFRIIIERYGLWRPDLEEMAPAFIGATQKTLPGFERIGSILAVEPTDTGVEWIVNVEQ